MFDAISRFFDLHIGGASAEGANTHAIEIATAALLAEVMRMDGEVTGAERDAVLRAVRSKFGLDAQQAQALIDLAEVEGRQATDYYQFTSLINKHFSREQKQQVVALLWDVAYADGVASPYEEHLIRKLADLLYVDHGDFIAAKLKARAAYSGDQ
jgi:uncharacterized tellurite resistance protein B-like protein